MFKGHDVDRRFRGTAAAHGDPASLLTDNGAVSAGRSRGHGRVALEVTLHARGIAFRHSRPYHPQTCGKVERFPQTLKKWLARQPLARSLRQLQTQLDTFRAYYNDVRPHRALGRKTPASAYAARPKAVPTGTPLHAGTDILVLVLVLVHVHVHVHDLDIRVLTTDGELLRELELDPTRDYQPQPKT